MYYYLDFFLFFHIFPLFIKAMKFKNMSKVKYLVNDSGLNKIRISDVLMFPLFIYLFYLHL